jgi:Ca-activated chloride channel family protein
MTGSEFHLLRPVWLLALLPLALLLWRLLRSAGEGEAWRGVVDAHLLPHLLSGVQGRAQRLPLWLLAAAWLLLVLALAGPTWERLPEPLYQARQFRVVALDLSPSMNATDLAPSRLVRARFKVLDLLRQSEEGQTAMLAYGAEPYVVSPLTTDVKTIAAQVPSLDTSLLPVAGARRPDLALDQAAELLRQAGAPEGEVILVTDGVENAAATNAAAARLHASGYRVSVLGVGTRDGSPVRSRDGGFLKDAKGAIRVSRLQEAVLRDLAAAGGGVYVTASPGDGDIALLRPGTPLAPGALDEEQTTQADRWREEGPVLLVLLLPLAAFAFRRGWLSPLLLLVCVLPPDADASLWDDLWQRPDQRATRLLEDGRATQAAELFQRQDWRAAARYRAGDYEQSLQALEGLEGPDTDYNRGNALAQLDRLEEAVAAYDRTLAADPGHADARHNRALLQRLMEQRQQRAEAPDRPLPRDETSPEAQQEQDAEDQVAADQASAGQSEDSEQQASESNADAGESQRQGQAEQQSAAGEQAQQASGGEDSGESQPESAQSDGDDGEQDAQPSPGEAGGDQSQGAQQAAGDGTQDDQGEQASAGQAAGEQPQGEQQAQDEGAQADQAQQSPAAQAMGEDGQEAAASQTAEPKGPEGEQEPQQASAGAEPDAESSPDDAASPGDQRESPGQDAASTQRAQAGDPADDGDPQDNGGRTAGQGGDESAGRDDSQPAQAEGATGSGDQADQTAAAPPRGDADSAAPPAGESQSPGMADLLGDRPGSQSGRRANEQMSMLSPEDRQAVEQMLRRVEDDPAALLRQRFLLQHLRRSGQLP